MIEEKDLQIPESKNLYKNFDTALTRARKDYSNTNYDIFRERIFDDTKQGYVQGFYNWVDPREETLKIYIQKGLTRSRYIYPFSKYIEVWFEDAGMWNMHKDFCHNYRLSTVCLRGNLSCSSIDTTYERMMDKDNCVILYVGDFNPSGNRRPYNIKTALTDMGLDIEVVKVLVTKPQIGHYDLKPDAGKPITKDRIAKAKNDPNIKWFIEKYGSNIHDVNAQAVDIPIVEELITNAIKQQIDVTKLDDLNESEPKEFTFNWDESNSCYRINLDERLEG